jgi:hypothetical protein
MVTHTPVFDFSLKFFFYPFHSNWFPNLYNEEKVLMSPPTRVNPTLESHYSQKKSLFPEIMSVLPTILGSQAKILLPPLRMGMRSERKGKLLKG